MFEVRFTAEAKEEIARQAQREQFATPGVMIHRQGPKGDVVRLPDGQAKWNVEHPHPWRAQVGDFQSFGDNPADVFQTNGISVWLALVPRPGELGVQVSVQQGVLYVEPLTV